MGLFLTNELPFSGQPHFDFLFSPHSSLPQGTAGCSKCPQGPLGPSPGSLVISAEVCLPRNSLIFFPELSWYAIISHLPASLLPEQRFLRGHRGQSLLTITFTLSTINQHKVLSEGRMSEHMNGYEVGRSYTC